MAPDLERLARMPWPKACWASSGTRLFNSVLAELMLQMRCPSSQEDCRKLSPGVGRSHVYNPDCLDPRLRRLDPEQGRGLAALDTPPEFPLGGDNQVLVKRIGRDFDWAGDRRA